MAPDLRFLFAVHPAGTCCASSAPSSTSVSMPAAPWTFITSDAAAPVLIACQATPVAARVYHTGGDPGILEAFHGTVDGKSLGNAIQRVIAGRAIEQAIGGLPDFLGAVEHAACPGIEGAPPPGAQSRDVAGALLGAHRPVHAFYRGERALHCPQRVRLRAVDPDIDERAEQRPRPPNGA